MDMMVLISLFFYAPVIVVIGMSFAMIIISVIDIWEQHRGPFIDRPVVKRQDIKPEKLVFYANYGGKDHYVTERELKKIRDLYPIEGKKNG